MYMIQSVITLHNNFGGVLSGKSAVYTVVGAPNPITSASYIAVGDSITETADTTGTITASLIPANYSIAIARPEPPTLFYINSTGSFISASAISGSSTVTFDMTYITNADFSNKKITITPQWSYIKTGSAQDVYCLNSTSSKTNATGDMTIQMIDGTYLCEAYGKVTTPFYIHVPGDGLTYFASNLIVLKPSTKAIKVKVDSNDNSFVPTLQYVNNNFIAIGGSIDNAISASYAKTASYALNGGTGGNSISASWASSSLSASYLTPTYDYTMRNLSNGDGNIASGPFSHAEGTQSVANGESSHAEGENALAAGPVSHAEGINCAANGIASHAEGIFCTANGTASHAGGFFTQADGDFQTVIGQNNVVGNTTDLFVIGNGAALWARSDIFNVSTSSVRVNGPLTASNIKSTLQGTASYALTASIALNAITPSSVPSASWVSASNFITLAQTASYISSSAIFDNKVYNHTASYALTASIALNAITPTSVPSASWVSASNFITLAQTASYINILSQDSIIFDTSASTVTTAASKSISVASATQASALPSNLLILGANGTTAATGNGSNGGNINIEAGNATALINASRTGGSINIKSGVGAYTGFGIPTAGTINLIGASGFKAAAAGAINITAGSPSGSTSTGAGGLISISAGSQNLIGSTGAGGNISITAGNSSGSNSAGNITLTPGIRYDSPFTTGSVIIPLGDLNVTNNITASTLYAQHGIIGDTPLSSAIVLASGDLYVCNNITASRISSSYASISNILATSVTSSLFGTASYANTASYVTASNVIGTITSASYALTASIALNASAPTSVPSASWVSASNFITLAQTASYISSSAMFDNNVYNHTASYALTASFVTASNIYGVLTAAQAPSASYLTTTNNYTVNQLTSSRGIFIGPRSDSSASLYISHSATQKAIEVDKAGGIETFVLDQNGTASFIYLLATGSLFGTASYAQTASYITSSNIIGIITAFSASWASASISSSYAISASYSPGGSPATYTSSLFGTASWANNALTASSIAATLPYTTIVTSSTNWITMSFTDQIEYVNLTTGGVTYNFTASNLPASGLVSDVSLFINNTMTTATASLSFPATWINLNGGFPTSLTSSKSAMVYLRSYGGTTIVGNYQQQF